MKCQLSTHAILLFWVCTISLRGPFSNGRFSSQRLLSQDFSSSKVNVESSTSSIRNLNVNQKADVNDIYRNSNRKSLVFSVYKPDDVAGSISSNDERSSTQPARSSTTATVSSLFKRRRNSIISSQSVQITSSTSNINDNSVEVVTLKPNETSTRNPSPFHRPLNKLFRDRGGARSLKMSGTALAPTQSLAALKSSHSTISVESGSRGKAKNELQSSFQRGRNVNNRNSFSSTMKSKDFSPPKSQIGKDDEKKKFVVKSRPILSIFRGRSHGLRLDDAESSVKRRHILSGKSSRATTRLFSQRRSLRSRNPIFAGRSS